MYMSIYMCACLIKVSGCPMIAALLHGDVQTSFFESIFKLAPWQYAGYEYVPFDLL